MNATEPTRHEIETTTPSGTDAEITVIFGSIDVDVPSQSINATAAAITEKRGTTVLDLGRHGGEQIYLPINDEAVSEIESAVDDTRDEDPSDYVEDHDDSEVRGGYLADQDATSDGRWMDSVDDGHVPADNQ